MSARRVCFVVALMVSVFCGFNPSSCFADTLVFHAVSSGERALDKGSGGGNPFASALIESLGSRDVRLGELSQDVKTLTAAFSRNRMRADVPQKPVPSDWQVVPGRTGEVRKALVLVTSDYSLSGSAPSLPGAAHDAERIAAALRSAGFETELALNLDGAGMREKLAAFGEESRAADAAIIYTTGHGVEVSGTVYVIPRDYPFAEKNGALASHAIPLSDVASSLHAKIVNLTFYGGCRDNPFAKK